MKKKIKQVVSLILSGCFLVSTSGCKTNSEKKNHDTQSKINLSITEELPKEKKLDTETRNTEKSLLKEEIVDLYSDKISSLEVSYNYEDFYLSSDQINQLLASINDLTCSYEMTHDLDKAIDDLASQITANSLNFIKQNPDFKYSFLAGKSYSVWENLLANIGMKNLIKEGLKAVFKNATNDINEDFCYLKDTQIVLSYNNDDDENIFGIFDDTLNVIILYVPNIVSDFINNNFGASCEQDSSVSEDFINHFLNILEHEINHARQMKCQHRTTEDSLDDINYSSDYITLLIESSAESALYNQGIDERRYTKSSFDYIYYVEREQESLLLLLGITNTSIDEYYNAIFNSDLGALYRFFNVKSKEDVETLYRIIYAMDSFTYRSELTQRFNDETELSDLKELIGLDFKVDLFKLIIKNLIKYTYENPDFSLEENINLFSIIKNLIIEDMEIVKECESDVYNCFYDKATSKKIIFLEESYISFLAKFYQTSVDEIRTIEDSKFSREIINASRECQYDAGVYTAKVQRILNRFPMLKPVLYTDYVDMNNYKLFLEMNNENTKTKGLTLSSVN